MDRTSASWVFVLVLPQDGMNTTKESAKAKKLKKYFFVTLTSFSSELSNYL